VWREKIGWSYEATFVFRHEGAARAALGEESPFRRALFAARFPFGGSGASAWLPHGRRHYRRIRNGEASAEAIRVVGR
jgi:hypothetical protein